MHFFWLEMNFLLPHMHKKEPNPFGVKAQIRLFVAGGGGFQANRIGDRQREEDAVSFRL